MVFSFLEMILVRVVTEAKSSCLTEFHFLVALSFGGRALALASRNALVLGGIWAVTGVGVENSSLIVGSLFRCRCDRHFLLAASFGGLWGLRVSFAWVLLLSASGSGF